MWTDPAWQQRGLDALRETLNVDSHQRKEMIQFLFDEGFWDSARLSWDAAIARWNDCMNPSKSAFWKSSELLALMHRFGRHHAFLHMAAELGYEVRRVPTEERRQALLERLADQLDASERALADARAELVRLQGEGVSKDVVPLRPSPRAFSLSIDDDMAGGAGRF